MKKFLHLMIALVMVLSLLVVPTMAADEADDTADATGLKITADKTDVAVGDTITYTFSVTNAQGVAGIEFHLVLPEGLKYVSGTVLCTDKLPLGGFTEYTEDDVTAYAFDATTMQVDGVSEDEFDILSVVCEVTDDVQLGGKLNLTVTDISIFDGSVDMNDFEVEVAADDSVLSVVCGHVNTELVGAQEATCLRRGYTGDLVCNDCGEIVTEGTDIPVTDHVWDNGTETTPASCTKTGVKTYTCTTEDCGETKTEEIDALGHDYTETATTPASCTEKGEKTYTCSRCGDTKTEEIDALGHDYTEKVTKASTCFEKGEKTLTCSRCGDSKTEEIPTTEHSWDEGKVTKEATTDAAGEKTYTCTVEGCGATKTEEIPALGTTPAGNGNSSTDNKTTTGTGTKPKTGDETNIVLWVVMMTVCAAGAVVVSSKKKASK